MYDTPPSGETGQSRLAQIALKSPIQLYRELDERKQALATYYERRLHEARMEFNRRIERAVDSHTVTLNLVKDEYETKVSSLEFVLHDAFQECDDLRAENTRLREMLMRHQCKAEEMSQECRQALAQTVQPLPSSAREFATSTPVASLSGHGIEDLEESSVGDTQVDQSSASQAAEDSATERDPVEHPFRCLYCKGRYKTAAKLADHIRRRHPEGKPYPCQECKCEYKAVAPLRKHVDAVHRERKFHCPECDFTTKTKQNLQEHAHLHKETFCCLYCLQ